MSSLNIEEDQRWVPTHVQVTVLRGRGLRAKGKHGTSDVYTIIQVGKEKYSTCVLEKTTTPEWKEECTFELLPGVLEQHDRDGSANPPWSSDLVLTVMHRSVIGMDVFLGQAVIPLDKLFQDRICMKNEWCKLNSKTGKKEKERGDIQVTVQFTKNNLTASMYDLSLGKEKPRSTFGKIKDRIKGKNRIARDSDEDMPSVIIGGYGPVSRMRNRLPSDGGGEEDYEDDEGGEGRRSKMRNFFLRGKLRKSSDTRSSTSLGSESSESSSRGGSLSPTAGISVVVSDLSNSPSNSSILTADSPEHTSPKLASYTCEFTGESGEITIPVPQPVCINGSHVYNTPPKPLQPGPVNPVVALVNKRLPLSQSLQNLNQQNEEVSVPFPKGTAADGRRWSFDKAGKEEKEAIAAALMQAGQGMGGGNEELHGDSQKKNQSRTCGEDLAEKLSGSSSGPGEDQHKGWFRPKDSHSRPSPHPVKPLTPEEKRRAERSEGRSVLDKLKSSIHPGKSPQSSEQDPEKIKTPTEGAGSYYHLRHSELVALLLQREADLHQQRAEFERQRALLAKREAELKKIKPQVRDLEDYIDTLLVRIMEQTPTILQVGGKLK